MPKHKKRSKSRNSMASRTSSRSGGSSRRSRSPRPSSGSRGSGGRGRGKSKKGRSRSHKSGGHSGSGAGDFLTAPSAAPSYTGGSVGGGSTSGGGGGGGAVPRRVPKKPNFDKKVHYVFFFVGVVLLLIGCIGIVLAGEGNDSMGKILAGAGGLLMLLGVFVPLKLKDENGEPKKAVRLPRNLRGVNPKGMFALSQILIVMGFAFTFALDPDLGKAVGMLFTTIGITMLFVSCFLFRNREKQLLDAIGAKVEKKALAADQNKMKSAAKASAYVDEAIENRQAVSIYEENSDDEVETTYWRNTSIFATKADVKAKRKLAAKRALKGATRTGQESESDSYDDAFKEVYQPYFIWAMTVVHFWMYFTSLAINRHPDGSQPFVNPLLPSQAGDFKNFNFMIGASSRTLIDMGALLVPLVKCYGQVYRLITPIFLHTGLIHLFMNLLFQLRVGTTLERIYGPWRVSIIYLLAGFGGNLVSAVFKPNGRPVAGASSSLYGLLGVVLIDLIQNWYNLEDPGGALLGLLGMIATSLGFGMLPYLDNFAHLGGMLTGVFAGVIFLPTITFGRKARQWKNGLVIWAIPMLGLYLVGLMYALFNGSSGADWCEACYSLDCPGFIPLCNDGFEQRTAAECPTVDAFQYLECTEQIGPRQPTTQRPDTCV